MVEVYRKGTEHLTFAREGKDDVLIATDFEHSDDPFYSDLNETTEGAFEVFLKKLDGLEALSRQIIMEFIINPEETTQAGLGRKFGISRQAVHDRLQTIKRKYPRIYKKVIKEQKNKKRVREKSEVEQFKERIIYLRSTLKDVAVLLYECPTITQVEISEKIGVSRKAVHMRIRSLKGEYPTLYKEITGKRAKTKKTSKKRTSKHRVNNHNNNMINSLGTSCKGKSLVGNAAADHF